jgi:hypothetical protein
MPGMASGAVNSEFLLLFNGTSWTSTAINATSSPYTDLYLSLHTSDPIAGNQSTSELSYSGSTPYARVAVVRTSSGFTVSSNTVTLTGNATFPQNTSLTSQTAVFFGLGTNSTGNGNLWFSGPICASTITPLPFTAATSGSVFTSHAHGYANGQPVVLWASTGSLPGGFSASTVYYVISTATDTFQLSATLSGSAITVTASGDGLVAAVSPITVSQNVTPVLTTGTTITGI